MKTQYSLGQKAKRALTGLAFLASSFLPLGCATERINDSDIITGSKDDPIATRNYEGDTLKIKDRYFLSEDITKEDIDERKVASTGKEIPISSLGSKKLTPLENFLIREIDSVPVYRLREDSKDDVYFLVNVKTDDKGTYLNDSEKEERATYGYDSQNLEGRTTIKTDEFGVSRVEIAELHNEKPKVVQLGDKDSFYEVIVPENNGIDGSLPRTFIEKDKARFIPEIDLKRKIATFYIGGKTFIPVHKSKLKIKPEQEKIAQPTSPRN